MTNKSLWSELSTMKIKVFLGKKKTMIINVNFRD